MAKEVLKIKAVRPQKFSARKYNRCRYADGARAFYRRFKMCRLCLRKYALRGQLPGVVKAKLVEIRAFHVAN